MLDQLSPHPNDQIQIEARNNNIAFLKKIQANLANLDMQLAASIQETSPDTKEVAVAKASTLLQEVRSAFNAWLDSNAPIVVQGAMNIGVIGILGSFLTFMGCPPFVGFGLAAAATSKKKPYDALLEMISNFRTTAAQRK